MEERLNGVIALKISQKWVKCLQFNKTLLCPSLAMLVTKIDSTLETETLSR